MNILPVWSPVRAAWRATLARAPGFARKSWPWLLALALIQFGLMGGWQRAAFLQGLPGWRVEVALPAMAEGDDPLSAMVRDAVARGRAVPPPPASFWTGFALCLGIFILLARDWCRRAPGMGRPGRDLLPLALRLGQLALLMAAPGLTLLLIAGGLAVAGGPLAAVLAATMGLLLFLALLARLALGLPPAARGAPLGLARTWVLAEGNMLRLGLGLYVCLLTALLAAMLVLGPLQGLAALAVKPLPALAWALVPILSLASVASLSFLFVLALDWLDHARAWLEESARAYDAELTP